MFFTRIRSLPLTGALAIALGLVVSHTALAQVPTLQPSQQLRPPFDPAPGGQPGAQVQFGWEAATDGQTTIVTVNQGRAAYAYTKDRHGRWQFRDALVAPAGYTTLGAAVSGDVALVEGVVNEANVVFVFKRTFGQWSHTQTLPASRASYHNHVALGGDYAAISDAAANGVAGAIYIYDKVGAGTYSFATELAPAGASEGYFSGYHIASEGDTLLAAAPGNGMIAAFTKSGGVWSEEAQLSHPGPGGPTDPYFGLSVDRALIATYGRTIESPSNPVVFRRQNGAWSVEQSLVHPFDADRGLRSPLALEGNLAVAREDGVPNETYLFVFELVGGTWTAKARLSEPVCGQSLSEISSEVSIAGRTIFVTCPTATTPHPVFDGRVHVYEVP